MDFLTSPPKSLPATLAAIARIQADQEMVARFGQRFTEASAFEGRFDEPGYINRFAYAESEREALGLKGKF